MLNLFSSVEGLSGENLTSKILHYLILRSPEIRQAFINFLSLHSPIGLLTSDELFSCQTEFCLIQPADEAAAAKNTTHGRIDLLLEMDNRFVGIENKLFAPFQDDQPEKYLAPIAAYARNVTRARTNHQEFPSEWCLFLLAPRQRSVEAEKVRNVLIDKAKQDTGLNPQLKNDYIPPFALIYWEDLLEGLTSGIRPSDEASRVVLGEFQSFLQELVGFPDRLIRMLPTLRTRWKERGSPEHWALLHKLWHLFYPQPNTYPSVGSTWAGYYFFPDESSRQVIGWFGFVDVTRINKYKGQNRCEFIIVLEAEHASKIVLSPEMKEIELQNIWVGVNRSEKAWLVDFQSSWKTVGNWLHIVAPFNQQVRD